MDDPRTTPAQEGERLEASGPGDLQYQELWFSLVRRAWSSVVLVPADRGGSADEVASRLAEVGKRVSKSPVTAITARSLEYGTALALADLPSFVGQRGRPPQAPWPEAIEMPPSSLDPSAQTAQAAPPEATSIQVTGGGGLPAQPSGPWGDGGPAVSSGARLIISIPPVVTQPLGLAAAQAADLVVLCVDLGVTRLADARRTLELVGRERLAGCFLIR